LAVYAFVSTSRLHGDKLHTRILFVIGVPLDHHHATWVTLEQVIDERNDDDDTSRGSSER
jgi:hypothetical protein